MTSEGELVYENYKATIEDLESYIEDLQSKHGDLVTAIDAVKEYSDIEETSEGLAPITDGIFVHADFKPRKGFRINAGDGVVVDKTADEVIDLLEERINNVEASLEDAQDKLLNIYDEIDAL